jgi:hypothetical protein
MSRARSVNLRLVADRADDLRAAAWLGQRARPDPQARIYSRQRTIAGSTKTIAGLACRKDRVARCARNIR